MVTTQIADRPARSLKHWTPAELEYLNDNYGLIPDKLLAGRLHRTESQILTRARDERIARSNNFYTARALAQLLGVPSGMTIVSWQKKGLLKGERSGKSQSKNKLWCFTEEEIVSCLKKNPWLVDLKCMEQHYFRSVVQEEWERDPWYTVAQAKSLLGICHASLYNYIRQGLLQVERRHYLGSPRNEGSIVRRSIIQAFLKQHRALHSFLENDPVLQKESAWSIALKTALIKSGKPVRLSINWLLECPSCKQKVKIAARPDLSGPQVREHFLNIYVNGTCSHGAICSLLKDGSGS